MTSSRLPASYGPTLRWKIILGGLGLVVAIPALAGALYFGFWGAENTAQLVMGVGLCVLLFAVGLGCALPPVLRKSLILNTGSLEVPGLFKTAVIDRGDIKGYRVLDVQGFKVLQLECSDGKGGNGRKVQITLLFQPDEILEKWFKGIADLDAQEISASLDEVRADARLGESSEIRVENVQRALRTGRILNIGAACVGVWAFFYPHPYILAFLAVAALPWLAMWLSHQYPGAFTVEDPGRNTVRADLTILVLLPGAVLMLRAISDFSLLDPIELILPTVVGLLAMLACLAWAGPLYRKKPRLLLVSAALLVAYPAGAIMIANAVFDYGTAMAYPVKVMKKRYTTGKGASQYVTVPAWGPVAEVNELEVSRDLYRATEVGQAICVRLHRGALGMEWTTIHPEAAC